MKRAFTLIELLVVIAIIAILAAILFPVFAQAREKARTVQCTSNCRQVSTALQMYAQDYDELLPGWPRPNATQPLFSQRDPVTRQQWTWCMIVPTMDPYLKNRQVWKCPSAASSRRITMREGVTEVSMGYNEYLYNTWHSLNYYDRDMNSLAFLAGTDAGVANIALVADSSFAGIFNDWSNIDGIRFPGEAPDFGLGRLKYANGWTGRNPANPRPGRHNNGCNVVFADGHAKFIPANAIRGGCCGTTGRARPGGNREWPVVNPKNIPAQ